METMQKEGAANQSVIHSYGREAMAKCGAMILGSDSHTRYGALAPASVAANCSTQSRACPRKPTSSMSPNSRRQP